MLINSFVHCDGIGPQKEKQLWQTGLTNWDDLKKYEKLSAKVKDQVKSRLAESTKAMKKKDGAFFEKHMPSKEM